METKMEQMPSVVKEVFNSESTGELIGKIEQTYELNEDQVGLLADEIGYVLFGVSSITAFKKNIQENLGLVPSKALAISTEIYGSIFQPVKKFLKDIDESELDPMQKRSMDGMSPLTRPSLSSQIPIKSQQSIPAIPTPSVTPAAARIPAAEVHNEGGILDLDSESLNHHDILSEIENPTPSVVQKQVSILPEESHLELEEGETHDVENESGYQPQQMASMQGSFGNNAAMFSQISVGSIHHDIVPNLNGFKPLAPSSEIAPADVETMNSQAGVHLYTPITDPLQKATETAQKLGQKLEGVVTSAPKEVYVAQKPSATKLDPYREPIE